LHTYRHERHSVCCEQNHLSDCFDFLLLELLNPFLHLAEMYIHLLR